ncbi:MAG: UMP kinase [Promethearchaeota archaeon]
MIKKNIVIKIGGSLLFTESKKLNLQKINEFYNIITNNNSFNKIIIVCGGGIIAREYIKAVRSFKGNEALCDIFGIEISRINAKLIIAKFSNIAFPQVPKSIEELSIAMLHNKIVFMGGLQPGQSTTSVALEVAEFIKADQLVILTDVNGIYNKDPKKFKDAKLLKSLNYNELQELILGSSGDVQAAAGEYRIFDAVSLQILKRSKINVFITSGKDLSGFKKFLNGENDIIGTKVSF